MANTQDNIKYESHNLIKNLLINRFKAELLTLVKSTQPDRVLDSGCGEGYLLSFLNDRMKGWHLEGFDINPESVAKAKQKIPGVNLFTGNIYNCDYPDRAFDLVLSTEVLEHLERPERALGEIRRLTKKWAILSVPNEPFFTIASFLSGKNISRFGNHRDHHNKWSAKSFTVFVNKYFTVSCVVKSFPWIIVLCEKKL